MEGKKGKKFYGSVTVSARGQIVVPVDARNDFNINKGDRLLVFGDLEQGIAMATLDIMSRTMAGTMELFREIKPSINNKAGKLSKKSNKINNK